MKRSLSLLFRALAFAVVLCLVVSCKKEEVEKVEMENQFAISLFSDKIKISDLLDNMDSASRQYIRIKENGAIYAYYADSVNNAVVAEDILSGIDDVTFESNNDFEIPNIPPSPVPVPVELPLDDVFSIPFEYEGYEITSVVLKSGRINFDIASNLNIIDQLSLSTDNIKMSDGSGFITTLDFNSAANQHIDLDLTDCTILPVDGNITFSVMINATISDEGIGGTYHFNISGSVKDIEFKSIDGSIADMRFDFVGTEEISFNIPNVYGDLSIATPEFSVKYTNSFGFVAKGFIDSLYLKDAAGNMCEIIKNWNEVELELHTTAGDYDSITDLDEQLVDQIDILKDYRSIAFNGNVVMGCDNVTGDMINDNSHIDIIADLSLPLEFSISNLQYIDTLDFNLSVGSGENGDGGIHIEDVFDDIEFKFVFENRLPIQIRPQVYMAENDMIIDSLFGANSYVQAYMGGEIMDDVLTVHLTDDKLINLYRTNKLILNMGLSSQGNNVVINANDYFNLKIGMKTKTTEIYMDDINL